MEIILYTNLDNVFSKKSYSSALVMPQLRIPWILCLSYICPILSILKIVLNIAFEEKYKSLCFSVYGALKYSPETVTLRICSKITLSHSILSYSSFCVNIFPKFFLLFVSALGQVSVKNFIEYWNSEISIDS